MKLVKFLIRKWVIVFICPVFLPAQDVTVKQYASPADFNREMAAAGKQDMHIKVSEKISPSLSWDKDILFYDTQGNIHKKILINRSDNQELVWLDKQNERMVISRPHIFWGASPGVIKSMMPGIQKVYDFEGNLLLDFKNTEYWLRPFMKNFYLGSTEGDEMSHKEKSALIGLDGSINKEIKGLHIPVVRAVSDSIGIVEDIIQATYWAFDHKGNILWKKIVGKHGRTVNISKNNLIAFSCIDKENKAKIFVINKNGDLVHDIVVNNKIGGLGSEISKSGNYLFWFYSQFHNPSLQNIRYMEIALYNLNTNTLIWKRDDIKFPISYGVTHIGFLGNKDEIIFVELSGSGEFYCFDLQGKILYQQSTNDTTWPSFIEIITEDNFLSIFHKETQKVTSLFFQE